MLHRINIYVTALLFFLLLGCEDLTDLSDGTSDPRDNIVDTWLCDENSEIYKSFKNTFYVDISEDPNDRSRLVLDNFYNMGLGKSVTARLSGRSLILDEQTVDGFSFISGQGNISADLEEIEWSYKVDDGSGVVDNVTATFTRR